VRLLGNMWFLESVRFHRSSSLLRVQVDASRTHAAPNSLLAHAIPIRTRQYIILHIYLYHTWPDIVNWHRLCSTQPVPQPTSTQAGPRLAHMPLSESSCLKS
jgi:hypothetical protein